MRRVLSGGVLPCVSKEYLKEYTLSGIPYPGALRALALYVPANACFVCNIPTDGNTIAETQDLTEINLIVLKK